MFFSRGSTGPNGLPLEGYSGLINDNLSRCSSLMFIGIYGICDKLTDSWFDRCDDFLGPQALIPMSDGSSTLPKCHEVAS